MIIRNCFAGSSALYVRLGNTRKLVLRLPSRVYSSGPFNRIPSTQEAILDPGIGGTSLLRKAQLGIYSRDAVSGEN